MGLEEFGTDVPQARLGYGEAISVPSDHRAALEYMQWTRAEEGMFVPCGSTWSPLPPGLYTIGVWRDMPCYRNVPLQNEEVLLFENSLQSWAMEQVEKFWSTRDEYARRHLKHRLGFLFYGPAGAGKSVLAIQMVQRLLHLGGIAFQCNTAPETFERGLQVWRQIEPERECLCLFEDLDAIIEKHGEADLLALLDGEGRLDRVINVATTNYPARLDKRILARPGRFNHIKRMEMPDEAVRRHFFRTKLWDSEGPEIEALVQMTEGLPLDALTDLIASVYCLGMDPPTRARELQDMLRHQPSSAESDGEVGFARREALRRLR